MKNTRNMVIFQSINCSFFNKLMNIVYKHDDLSYVWKSWMIKDAGTRSNNKSMNGIARPSISSIHTHRLMIIESLCSQKMAVPSLLTFIEVKLSSLTFSVVSNFEEKIEPRPAGICAWFWRSRNSITRQAIRKPHVNTRFIKEMITYQSHPDVGSQNLLGFVL